MFLNNVGMAMSLTQYIGEKVENIVRNGGCVSVRQRLGTSVDGYGEELDAIVRDGIGDLFLAFEKRSETLTPSYNARYGINKIIHPIKAYQALGKFDTLDNQTQADIWKEALKIRIRIEELLDLRHESNLRLGEVIWGQIIREAVGHYVTVHESRREPKVARPQDTSCDSIFAEEQQALEAILERRNEVMGDKGSLARDGTRVTEMVSKGRVTHPSPSLGMAAE